MQCSAAMAASKLGFGGPGQRSKYDFENADAATNGRASEIDTYAGSEALPKFGQSTKWYLPYGVACTVRVFKLKSVMVPTMIHRDLMNFEESLLHHVDACFAGGI